MRPFPTAPGATRRFARARVTRPIPATMALRVALATTVVVLAAPPLAATAAPPSRVTFGIEPSSVSGPDGRANFQFSATPGALLSDQVAVVNYSSVAVNLQIYPADALETANGGFGLALARQRQRGVGAWVSVPRADDTVTVTPATSKGPGVTIVPFTVHIPDTTTPGDHVGGIVASLRTVGTNASGQRIILDQRIGTRVFIHVAGVVSAGLRIEDLHESYAGTWDPIGRGRVVVTYDLANTGDVDLDVAQSVSANGLIADSHHVTLADDTLVLPGALVHESVPLNGVWPQFVATSRVSASSVNASAPAISDASASASASATTWTWAVPWTLFALVALFVLAGLLVWRRRSSAKVAS